MKLNDMLQWAGTGSLMTMYIIMSFFPSAYPWNLVFGCLGGVLYFVWSLRVANKPQMIVNAMGITITVLGLLKAWG